MVINQNHLIYLNRKNFKKYDLLTFINDLELDLVPKPHSFYENNVFIFSIVAPYFICTK